MTGPPARRRTSRVGWLESGALRGAARMLPAAGAERLRARAQRRRDLRHGEVVADLLPQIREQVEAQVPRSRDWSLGEVVSTTGDTAVSTFTLANPGTPVALLRVPLSDAARATMRRGTQASQRLHAIPGLSEWSALVPLPVAVGAVGGFEYEVDVLLPGTDGRHLSAAGVSPERVADAALGSIAILHRATARRVRVDDDQLAAWFGASARSVRGEMARRGASPDRLDGVVAWTGQRLNGLSVTVAWGHGDFWPANVILDPPTCRVTGIIDWDRAHDGLPPAVDVAQMLVESRPRRRAHEFGDVVRDVLRGGWTPREHALLAAAQPEWDENPELPLAMLAIMWLRAVGWTVANHPDRPPHAWWWAQNVERVASAFARGLA